VYWLDNPDLEQIGASNYELAVIDYSADGTAAQAFSATQIGTLRSATCQRRVLAYLSVGQAERYRWYWRPSWGIGRPWWLVARDADWPQHYWTRYWSPTWQGIMEKYLDNIMAAGFDGVYLDRIDAYAEPYAAGHELDVVRLVHRMAHYARTQSPRGEDFGVIVQNAEELAAYHPDYVADVSGIGREELYVQATNLPVSRADRASAEATLDLFRQQSRGHLVLTIDYASQPELVRSAYEHARAKGYVPYVTDVALDRMRLNQGYEPVCHPLLTHPIPT
jgi:cysteinyl-tRNA synthetase